MSVASVRLSVIELNQKGSVGQNGCAHCRRFDQHLIGMIHALLLIWAKSEVQYYRNRFVSK